MVLNELAHVNICLDGTKWFSHVNIRLDGTNLHVRYKLREMHPGFFGVPNQLWKKSFELLVPVSDQRFPARAIQSLHGEVRGLLQPISCGHHHGRYEIALIRTV